MTVTISIGSGKGGTGKSTIISNLAYLLTKKRRKVCIVDLDIGGADLHIFFGLFKPHHTITDFLTRKIDSLTEAVHSFDTLYGLQLIPGSGDTLQTANLTFQEKQRLLRALHALDADVILLDVGAGTNYHVLDFFMHSDIQICVTQPEPAAIMDLYTFLQLATIRKTLSSFLSTGEVSSCLKSNRFETLADVFELAEQTQEGARQKAQESLRYFNPLLIVNKTGNGTRLNKLKLHTMTTKYLGVNLPDLGDIAEDPQVVEAARGFLPVCEYAPSSPASAALVQIGDKIEKVIDLYARKQQNAQP